MDYKSQKWVKKRLKILKKDRYLCKNCLRYGKRVEANTVHHIYPAKEYPEYEWKDWNLISLCGVCHNRMHDRDSDKLSSEGERLKSRTVPPTPLGQASDR